MTLRIAADWGTSALRLWALGPDGGVIAERRSDAGMGKLSPSEFEPTFLALAGDLIEGEDAIEVLICGMAGARSGWKEAPYLSVPCTPHGTGAIHVETRDPRLSVWILPGLAQEDPPDVMRGEETQIAGFLATVPGFDGVLCLPGTHSKWVRVKGGKITGFHTVMTGELFALLSGTSVLRLSMSDGDPWCEAAFAECVAFALKAPETFTASLFSIRAKSLLTSTQPGKARSELSGRLIGQELAAMQGLWKSHPVVLIGARGLSAHYEVALRLCGAEAQIIDGDLMVLAGLRAAFSHLEET